MKRRRTWAAVGVTLVAALVLASSILEAVTQRSWAPVWSSGWLPAVVAAAWWPAARTRCWTRARRIVR